MGRIRSCFILIAAAALFVGCDPGTTNEEMDHSRLDGEYNAEYWNTRCDALSLSMSDSILTTPFTSTAMSVGKVNLPMVDWFQNTPEAAPDDTPDVCDCSGMCNACMDAYICGHEAAILEYCDDCAQCQKECTPDTES